MPDLSVPVVPKIASGRRPFRPPQEELVAPGGSPPDNSKGPPHAGGVCLLRVSTRPLAYELALDQDDPKTGPKQWRFWWMPSPGK